MKTLLGYTQLSEFYRAVASRDFSETVLDNSDAHHSVLRGGRGSGDEILIYAGLHSFMHRLAMPGACVGFYRLRRLA